MHTWRWVLAHIRFRVAHNTRIRKLPERTCRQMGARLAPGAPRQFEQTESIRHTNHALCLAQATQTCA